ncbi:unnamed protein product [Owenia fusiformis]|uniref:Uncharacterized protein n=1 Tax=Owenia fusiformis TaxID=6347 RepID=A0A8J1XZ60_OWEFU|nr:unnamed protein product [Owenia fusiformis]
MARAVKLKDDQICILDSLEEQDVTEPCFPTRNSNITHHPPSKTNRPRASTSFNTSPKNKAKTSKDSLEETEILDFTILQDDTNPLIKEPTSDISDVKTTDGPTGSDVSQPNGANVTDPTHVEADVKLMSKMEGGETNDTTPGQAEGAAGGDPHAIPDVAIQGANVVDLEDSMKQLYTEEHHLTSVPERLEIDELPKPLSKCHIFLLNLSWYGLSLMFLILSVEVVPAQIHAMVGTTGKGRWLGGMVAGGAIVTFISGPLVGMKSDRLVSKWGKRRPVMLGATLMLSLALWGMAFSAPKVMLQAPLNTNTTNATNVCMIDLVEQRCKPYLNTTTYLPLAYTNGHHHKDSVPQQQGGVNIPEVNKKSGQDTNFDVIEEERFGNIGLYIGFYLLVITCFTCVTVPLNALIADKSRPEQRGLNSGVMGFMILFGNISGAAVGLFFLQMGVFSVYGCVTGVVVITVLITVFTTPEEPAKPIHEPIEWRKILKGYWEPLKDHDFRWVFFTRFLMQQGVSTVTGFLEYWLSDMVNLPYCWSPERSVALMLLPLLGAAAISSIACGIVSDRIGRRKPLVITSALMMCITTSILSFMRGEYAYYVAIALSVIYGMGLGSFQAVDFALVMDVLDDDKDKAKDIAVWSQAMILPQALATPIGGVLLDVFERIDCELGLGYIILFLLSSFYFFLSGVFVLKIRGVK